MKSDDVRIGLVAGVVVLAGASTTPAVPSLRALVEAHGAGAGAGALFVAAHVLGQVPAAVLLGRRLARGGALDARRLVVGALIASALLTGAMALVAATTAQVEALIALRAADGIAHVVAVMGLLGSIPGEGRLRLLGGLLVVGIAAGLGIGAALVRLPIAVAVGAGAVLAAIAVPLAAAGVPRRVERAPRAAGPIAAPPASVLAVAAMRFGFGAMTVGLPFLAVTAGDRARIGATLGVMMLASVATLPVVAAAAHRHGWTPVARLAAVVLAAGFAAIAVPGLIGSWPGLGWALVGGLAAAGIYAAALAAISAIDDAGARSRAVGAVHAVGSAGHVAGALACGAAISAHGLGMAPASATALLGAVAAGLGGVALALGRRLP